MARGRIISKSIGHSEKLAMLYDNDKKLAEFAILLFTWIIPHTDDYGQLSASPLSLKLQVIPASPRPISDFQAALKALQKTNLIQIHGGFQVLRIVNFDNFQTFRVDRERQNKYPDIQWSTNDIPRYDSGTPEVKVSEVKVSEENISKPIAPSEEKESLKAGDGFNKFWKAYPKKKSKIDAQRSWTKIKPNDELLQIILTKIEEAKTCIEWTKDGGQFIPHPATWLNRGCWHDEYEQVGQRPATKGQSEDKSHFGKYVELTEEESKALDAKNNASLKAFEDDTKRIEQGDK